MCARSGARAVCGRSRVVGAGGRARARPIRRSGAVSFIATTHISYRMGGLFSRNAATDDSPHVAADALDFIGRDGKLYANTIQFNIKGCNWFGSEAYNGPPNGLDEHSIEWYLDFLKKHDFNAIRLLFNHEHVLKDDIVETPQRERLLFQTRYVRMFAVIAREAAKRGILVLIACHRITHTAWPGAGLWYDSALGFSEARVLQSWDALASQLCDSWNIIGVDLVNEPHSSSWGKGLPTDWNKAAERIGNHVHSRCARWLVFVEGVGYTPGAPGADDPGMGIWWGSNLVGARTQPVVLANQEKLVYAPHVYGPSVYVQSYFKSPMFPNNMASIWDRDFAFAKEHTGRPVVLGEIGGSYVGADRIWQDWAIPFMVSNGFSCFYFALNPATDTGGFMSQDWSEPAPGSPEEAKLKALEQLPSSDVFEVCPACRVAQESSAHAHATPPAHDVSVVPPPSMESRRIPSSPSPPPPHTIAPATITTMDLPLPPLAHESAGGERPLPPLPSHHPQPSLPSPVRSPMPPVLTGEVQTASPKTSESLQHSSSLVGMLAVVALVVGMAYTFLHVRRRFRGLVTDRLNASLDQLMQQKKQASSQATPKSVRSKPRRDSKKRDGTGECAPAEGEPDESQDSLFLFMQPVEALEPDVPAAAGQPSFDVGDRVRVRGLQRAAHHNGAEGVVTGHIRAPDGQLRFNVSCDAGECLCVLPENLAATAAFDTGIMTI